MCPQLVSLNYLLNNFLAWDDDEVEEEEKATEVKHVKQNTPSNKADLKVELKSEPVKKETETKLETKQEKASASTVTEDEVATVTSKFKSTAVIGKYKEKIGKTGELKFEVIISIYHNFRSYN